MCGVPPLILEHLISSVVSLSQLVSPSVALPAQLVSSVLSRPSASLLSFPSEPSARLVRKSSPEFSLNAVAMHLNLHRGVLETLYSQ